MTIIPTVIQYVPNNLLKCIYSVSFMKDIHASGFKRPNYLSFIYGRRSKLLSQHEYGTFSKTHTSTEMLKDTVMPQEFFNI
jgi:hypothetical protein